MIYINGTPVARHNMASWPTFPANDQPAEQAVWGSAENQIHTYIVESPPLKLGQNVIAAEVHQNDQGSGDTSFDLRLYDAPTLPPPDFSVIGHDTSNGLELDFSWSAVPEATAYRLERRDLTDDSPQWATFTLTTDLDASGGPHFSQEIADYRLIAVLPGGDSIPTMVRRIVYINDPANLVDDTGYIYGSQNLPVDVGVPAVISQAELANQGYSMGATLTLAGVVSQAEGPLLGPGDLAALGIVLVGGAAVILYTSTHEITFDSVTIPRTGTATGRPQYPYRTSKDDAKAKIVFAIAAATTAATLNASQASYAADQCIEQVDNALASGTPVDPGSNGEHPCEYLPVYFPSAGSAVDPAELRYDAIAVHPGWIYQERRKPSATSAWYQGQPWPEGVAAARAGAADGCLEAAKPAGPPWPDALSWECDEFPNRSMQANILTAGPGQAALRWATRKENGTTTGGEAWSLNRLFNACVEENNDPFLVVPLTNDTIPVWLPLPPSFHYCPD